MVCSMRIAFVCSCWWSYSRCASVNTSLTKKTDDAWLMFVPSTAEKRELNCWTLWCKRVIRLDCRLCQRRCRPRQWPVTWFWYPINRQTAYRRRHISEVTGIVLSDRDRRLKIGSTRKPGLTGGLSRAPYAQVWRGIRGLPFPQKKNEFGIGGDAISRCLLRGLLALFLVNILSRSQFHPSISMQIWTNYETHIFKKWGYVACPQTPVALTVNGCIVAVF